MNYYQMYEIRIYPTKEQEELIHELFRITRFLYNKLLEQKKNQNTISKTQLFQSLEQYYLKYPFIKKMNLSFEYLVAEVLRKKATFKKMGVKEEMRLYLTHPVVIDHQSFELPVIESVKIRGYKDLWGKSFFPKYVKIKKIGTKYYCDLLVQKFYQEPFFLVNLKCPTIVPVLEQIRNYNSLISHLNVKLARCQKNSHNSLKIMEKIENLERKRKNAIKKNIPWGIKEIKI